MITSIAILTISTSLFFFYLQTLCEQVLRREFGRAYSQDVLNALDLEFPRVRQAMSAQTPMSYEQVRMALKCDLFTLTYMVKNGDPNRKRLSMQERMLIGYFRVLLLSNSFRFREKESVMKLTTILRYFANLTGERINPVSIDGMAPSAEGAR